MFGSVNVFHTYMAAKIGIPFCLRRIWVWEVWVDNVLKGKIKLSFWLKQTEGVWMVNNVIIRSAKNLKIWLAQL